MLIKQIHNNELYLWNEMGELVFKRWLDLGYSKYFCEIPLSTKETTFHVTDDELKNENNGFPKKK